MKNLLLLLGFTALFISCSQEEELLSISENEPTKKETKAYYSYRSECEASIPMYKYYMHNGTMTDHYFSPDIPLGSSGSNKVIKGRTYQYHSQDFNLPNNTARLPKLILNRLYSPSLNNHILSTSRTVNGYNFDIELGYIFTSHEMGTVALKEYYSDLYKNHYYTCEDMTSELSYRYVKTVGYVYPGQKVDPNKQAFSITLERSPYNPLSTFKAIFKIRVRERDTYTNLSYTMDFAGDVAKTITLKNTYAIVKCDVDIIVNGCTASIFGIAEDRSGSGVSSNYPPCWPSSRLWYDRTENGYNTIFKFTYNDVLGTSK